MLSNTATGYLPIKTKKDTDYLVDMIDSLKNKIDDMEKEIIYLHDEIKTLYFKGIKRLESN